MEWQPIETAPDDTIHVRGMWVYSAETGKPLYWQADVGFVTDGGDFVGIDGDDFGWCPEDYTHWLALPEPPAARNKGAS